MFTRRLLAFAPPVRSMATPTSPIPNPNPNPNPSLPNVNVNANVNANPGVGPRERLIRAKVSLLRSSTNPYITNDTLSSILYS